MTENTILVPKKEILKGKEFYYNRIDKALRNCQNESFEAQFMPSIIDTRIDSEKDAIAFSLGIEKDSILLYEGMKNIVADNDKMLIDKIISQEKEHVMKLWNLRKDMLKR